MISINGYIDPVSTRYLSRSLAEAERNNANLVLINLNTPGGLLSSTRKITSNLINSSIPIVVYVSPNGARASSAGTFILASSHIAAMAPGTHLGAASPVGLKSEELPTTVELAIETTDAAIKGQTASSSYKPATLENGINIMVPPFINSGDKIVLDTRTLEYIKKIK